MSEDVKMKYRDVDLYEMLLDVSKEMGQTVFLNGPVSLLVNGDQKTAVEAGSLYVHLPRELDTLTPHEIKTFIKGGIVMDPLYKAGKVFYPYLARKGVNDRLQIRGVFHYKGSVISPEFPETNTESIKKQLDRNEDFTEKALTEPHDWLETSKESKEKNRKATKEMNETFGEMQREKTWLEKIKYFFAGRKAKKEWTKLQKEADDNYVPSEDPEQVELRELRNKREMYAAELGHQKYLMEGRRTATHMNLATTDKFLVEGSKNSNGVITSSEIVTEKDVDEAIEQIPDETLDTIQRVTKLLQGVSDREDAIKANIAKMSSSPIEE